jgi:hypothetical protein
MIKQEICNLVKLPLIDTYHYSLQTTAREMSISTSALFARGLAVREFFPFRDMATEIIL